MKLSASICLLALILATTAIAASQQPTTFITTQYEMRDFKNSKQKNDGTNKKVILQHRLMPN